MEPRTEMTSTVIREGQATLSYPWPLTPESADQLEEWLVFSIQVVRTRMARCGIERTAPRPKGGA